MLPILKHYNILPRRSKSGTRNGVQTQTPPQKMCGRYDKAAPSRAHCVFLCFSLPTAYASPSKRETKNKKHHITKIFDQNIFDDQFLQSIWLSF